CVRLIAAILLRSSSRTWGRPSSKSPAIARAKMSTGSPGRTNQHPRPEEECIGYNGKLECWSNRVVGSEYQYSSAPTFHQSTFLLCHGRNNLESRLKS